MQIILDNTSSQPLHSQLEDAIRSAILEGRIKPGDRLPPIRKLCETTGLAYQTVSKATRSLVKEGVLVARTGAGTRVAELNTRPASGVLGIISTLPLTEVSRISPYFAAALLGIQDETIKSGRISAYDLWSNDRPLWTVFDNLSRVDGLIILNSLDLNSAEVENIAQAGKPIVLLGGAIEPEGVPTIRSDNYGDSRRAVERLLELGHRDILYVGGQHQNTRASLDRFRGYRDTISAAGHALRPEMAVWLEGAPLAQHFLSLSRQPTAMFIAGGIYRIGEALAVMQDGGVTVGRDVTLCGWDAANAPALHSLPCIRIVQPIDDLGHLAVKTLLAVIDGQSIDPQSLILHATIEEHDDPSSPSHSA